MLGMFTTQQETTILPHPKELESSLESLLCRESQILLDANMFYPIRTYPAHEDLLTYMSNRPHLKDIDIEFVDHSRQYLFFLMDLFFSKRTLAVTDFVVEEVKGGGKHFAKMLHNHHEIIRRRDLTPTRRETLDLRLDILNDYGNTLQMLIARLSHHRYHPPLSVAPFTAMLQLLFDFHFLSPKDTFLYSRGPRIERSLPLGLNLAADISLVAAAMATSLSPKHSGSFAILSSDRDISRLALCGYELLTHARAGEAGRYAAEQLRKSPICVYKQPFSPEEKPLVRKFNSAVLDPSHLSSRDYSAFLDHIPYQEFLAPLSVSA